MCVNKEIGPDAKRESSVDDQGVSCVKTQIVFLFFHRSVCTVESHSWLNLLYFMTNGSRVFLVFPLFQFGEPQVCASDEKYSFAHIL